MNRNHGEDERSDTERTRTVTVTLNDDGSTTIESSALLRDEDLVEILGGALDFLSERTRRGTTP